MTLSLVEFERILYLATLGTLERMDVNDIELVDNVVTALNTMSGNDGIEPEFETLSIEVL